MPKPLQLLLNNFMKAIDSDERNRVRVRAALDLVKKEWAQECECPQGNGDGEIPKCQE